MGLLMGLLLYLLFGFGICTSLYEEAVFENPIFAPLIILFYPLLLCAIPFILVGAWVQEVRKYYKRKRKVDKENDI